MTSFAHERLDVYGAAIEFLLVADQVAGALPRGRSYLADQLRRAALSIPLNVAEGAGEFAPADKARFDRMARRSGTECAAMLHACKVLALSPDDTAERARTFLDRIVAMLTALVLRLQESGAGSGAGSGADPGEK